MRILYLVPDLFGPPGGIARYCRMVCKAVAETDKVSLHVIALNDSASSSSEAAATLPHVAYYPCGRDRLLFVKQALKALVERPNVILVGHVNFSHLGWLLARLAGARYVVFIYGVDVWEPLSALRRWALQKAALLLSISEFTSHQAATANNVAMNKIRLLYNCLDPQVQSPFHPKDEKAHPSLLTVARILKVEVYKGHDLVIRALPKLLKRFPDLVYDVVGDGDGRPALEALAVEQEVAHAVRFHGVLTDEEVTRHYASASLFIMPSRREGFGFVFIEAMAQGTPAIGGNRDATPEVIVDGETGYIIDPTSVDAVVSAVTRLLEDDELRERMGRAAVLHVNQKFGFPNFKQCLSSHLSSL